MAPSRIASSAAALALIGASVFAGVIPASAYEPTAPSLEGPIVDGSVASVTTNVNGPSFGGTMQHVEGGSETTIVSVSKDGGAWEEYCYDFTNYTDTASPAHEWSCATEDLMSPGVYDFRAQTQDDNTGDLSAFSPVVSYTVGGTQTPYIVFPAAGSSTQDATPFFQGYGPSIGNVTVTADGANILCSVATATDGYWSCDSGQIGTPLSLGPHSVVVGGTDITGAPTASSEPMELTVAQPDSPVLEQTYSPWYTSNPSVVVSATVPPDTVELRVWRWVDNGDGTYSAIPYCDVDTSTSGGTYVCDPTTSDFQSQLLPGSNELTGSVWNEAGDQSILGESIFINLVKAPTITSPGPDNFVYTTDNTPTWSGTSDVSTTSVKITPANPLALEEYCSTGVEGGPWSCTAPEEMSDGTYEYVARSFVGETHSATSATHTLVIDTTAPDQPAVTSPGIVDGPHPTLTGTGEPGATVAVYSSGSEIACDTSPVVVDEEGNWSCTPTEALYPGDYSITAIQVDRAGLISPISEIAAITVAVPSAPAAPVIISPESGTVYWEPLTIWGDQTTSGGYPIRIDVTAVSDAGTETCSDVIDPSEFNEVPVGWNCPLFIDAGTYDISAVASIDGVPGTSSTASNSIEVTYVAQLPKPTVTFTLGPASVAFEADGVPEADLYATWYRAIPGAGEGIEYIELADCGTIDEGESEGESADGGLSFAVSSADCGPFTALEPGIYNSWVRQYGGGESYSEMDDYILIPETPTMTTQVTGDIVTFAGNGGSDAQPTYRVYVQNVSGASICSDVVDTFGNWSCSATLPAGTGSYRAIQQADGWVPQFGGEYDYDRAIPGLSAYSTTRTATVVAPAPPAPPIAPPLDLPTPTPTATPTPTPTPTPTLPSTFSFTFTIGATSFLPGETTTLTGSGVPALSQIDAELHSTPVHLGTTTATTDGSFDLTVTVPEDAEPGAHEIVITVTPPGGAAVEQAQSVTILSPARSQGEVVVGSEAEELVASDAATADRSDPAAPSSLTNSIDTVQSIMSNPVVITGAVITGFALLLLVAIPAELLNSTISENYGRITRRLPKAKLPWWERFRDWLRITPVFGGVLITFVTALIFGFSDPRFGFDVTSLRTVLALGLALLVVGYLSSVIAGAIIRRTWGLATTVELKPLGILLAVVGVVLSRLIDFSPGFLIGLVLGLSVVGVTTAAQRAKATLIQGGVVFGFALIAWIVYSILSATTETTSFVSALTVDTMVAITAEGLTALFVGMLPFKLLNGSSVFEYSKVLWGISYTVAAAAFVLIVVPSAWGELDGPIWNWLIVIGVFAVAALAIYLFFRLTNKEDDGDDASVVENEDEEALEL